MNHDIVTTATVTSEQARSILDTWESQAGYWETPFRNHQHQQGEYGLDLVSVECECTDQDGLGQPVEGKWWLINEHTVVEGIKRILAGDVVNCSQEIAALLRDGDIDCCDIDQADFIVQAGLFGTLVYG